MIKSLLLFLTVLSIISVMYSLFTLEIKCKNDNNNNNYWKNNLEVLFFKINVVVGALIVILFFYNLQI